MKLAIVGFMVAGAVMGAAPPSASLDDSKILGALDVATSNEVDQAELALDRTQAPAVKAFARMMIDQNTADNEQGHAVAKHVGLAMTPSDVSNNLKEASNEIVVDLRPLRKSQFDRAYVDTQVRSQQRLVKLIDEVLSPEAQLPEVRTYVSDVREHVEHRIDAAQKTLDKLPR
jgi:putative membrane protein